MVRRLQGLLMLGVWGVAARAAAQEPPAEPPAEAPPEQNAEPSAPEAPPPEEPAAEPAPEEPAPEAPAEPQAEAASERTPSEAPTVAPTVPEQPTDVTSGEGASGEKSDKSDPWETYVTGYFRAPMALGISERKSPDDPDGPPKRQVSYGPNRTVDANYYSFAYTRLQEQDWAEVFVHAKKNHVDAAVGWMGYWFQSVGFRNNDAAWAPGLAYLTLDTDFDAFGLKPHVALTGGAWWPKFGTFDKYDTYTLGRFRQLGEQVKLTVPVSPDVTLSVTQGFGSGRDGLFNPVSPPPYQASVGVMLLHYEHLQVTYGKYVDVGLHYNHQWTKDSHLYETTTEGRGFSTASEAHVTTVGGEVTLSAPYAGSLWVSPSQISVQDGWVLGESGIEVVHSLAGEGLAVNYLAYTGSLADSTGTGTIRNVGALYENTLSNILGNDPRRSPELTLNVFGLFVDTTLDLPEGSSITQDRIGQLKYGADLEYQALDWVGFMLRWDEVNYNLDHPGYVFSAITPRITFSSHFMSGESIYIQYSRYRYGDQMTIAGKWPWGTPLVAGSDVVQGGEYTGDKPDMDVVKLQATVAF